MTKEQVYSTNNEEYLDYEDLMYKLQECCGYTIGESVEVWEADKKEFLHADFVDINDLIENMQSHAVDECGEFAEEYLNELNKMQKLDLHVHISEWFNKNAKIDFYGVENEHKIMVTVE